VQEIAQAFPADSARNRSLDTRSTDRVGHDRLTKFVSAMIALTYERMSITARSKRYADGVYVWIRYEEDNSLIIEICSSHRPMRRDFNLSQSWLEGSGTLLRTLFPLFKGLETSPGVMAEFLINTLAKAYGMTPNDLYQFAPSDLVRDLLNGEHEPEFAMNPELSAVRKSRLHLGLSFPKCLNSLEAKARLE